MLKSLFQGQLPQLILFDLDGTLVDSVPDLAAAVDEMLLALDRPAVGLDSVRHWVGNGAQVLIRRALNNSMDDAGVETALFEQAQVLFFQAYAKHAVAHSALYSGVLECLSGLAEAKIPMGLVTNKPMQFTTPLLEGLGIAQYFSVVVGGDSYPEKKPHPMPLQQSMAQCGALPEMTLMVGDSISDLNAARAAGCAIVCVPYGYNHGQDIRLSGPDRVVDSLAELTLGL